MIHYLLRWTLLLSGLFVLPLLVIRAQPHDDNDLRAFLTPPEDCPTPCFLGVRPGVTTAAEAIAILEGHEWVSRVATSEFADDLFIVWDNPPLSIINPERSALMRFHNNVVEEINVFTRLKLINVLTVYGQPAWGEAIPILRPTGSPGVYYMIAYQPESPMFEFVIPDGNGFGKLETVLDANITIHIGQEPETGGSAMPHLVDLMGVE